MTLTKKKTFTRKERQGFILLLAELLDNGFSLDQGLQFMMTVNPSKKKEIKHIKKGLSKGKSLSCCLSKVGFTQAQLAQLSFADIHGDISGTLIRMSEQLVDEDTQRANLIKLISYPILLLFFLMSMVFGMKWYILPQLGDMYEQSNNQNIGLVLVDRSPIILLGILLTVAVVTMGSKLYFSNKTAIHRANTLCQIPVLKHVLTKYYTQLFATEWGMLLTQGMEFREVVLIMDQDGYTPLMKEMSQQIKEQLEQGYMIDEPIKEWRFFSPELTWIIHQGEVKGNLGKELFIYGKKEWKALIEKIEKGMSWLQPLMFLLIAVLIISVYAALLLPIYSGMGDLY
ncbi:MAG: competence type IV pilus assembly protein ComGB [Vagococcus sp.]